jgi:hypothetical protein
MKDEGTLSSAFSFSSKRAEPVFFVQNQEGL